MRAARIATSPEGSPAIQPTPADIAPAPEPTVWIAAPEDLARPDAGASPVHAMQAQIALAYHPGPQSREARWTFDPIRLALLVYTIGFWWGVIALTRAVMHAWAR